MYVSYADIEPGLFTDCVGKGSLFFLFFYEDGIWHAEQSTT